MTGKGLESVEVAVNATRDAVEQGLGYVVTVYLNIGYSSLPGELSIPFGGSGYVALDEIKDATQVEVLATHAISPNISTTELAG